MSEYLTVPEAAEFIKVHRNTILSWLNKGIINGVKFGKDWRILKSELLNRGRVGASDDTEPKI